MTVLDLTVAAPDGPCPASLHLPDGDGPWPGVIMYPDAAGTRPTFRAMADRLAGLGYATLLPDVYYREGDWKPFDVHTVFADPDERARLMSLGRQPDRRQGERRRGRVPGVPRGAARGGGRAGRHHRLLHGRADLAGRRGPPPGPDRRGGVVPRRAAGRRVRPGQPRAASPTACRPPCTSPRPRTTRSCPPEQLDRLGKAYTEAGVAYTIETYPGGHGFAVPDNVGRYDEALAERHWAALETLYGSTLRS